MISLHPRHIRIDIDKTTLARVKHGLHPSHTLWIVGILSTWVSAVAITYCAFQGWILSYGDSESHINIAKKVVDALTPGFAQLGGIWLPLPHMLMLPLVVFDPLWRSGIAGAIISGIAFVITIVVAYKTVYFLTNKQFPALVSVLILLTNPNLLYMQSTPLTEVPLLATSLLSSYFFIRYVESEDGLGVLILSAFFAFCAALTRYDGWFLSLWETGIIFFLAIVQQRIRWQRIGEGILFVTLAAFAIGLWILWDFIILGDPFYFIHSTYSAHAQQMSWLAKNELPAYRNLPLAALYYTVTAYANTGVVVGVSACFGLMLLLRRIPHWVSIGIVCVLLSPYIFNILSLYTGQDVIFIPSLTPSVFEWHLFNVRYGILMVPACAILCGYLISQVKPFLQFLLCLAILIQGALYPLHIDRTITLDDGLFGLSASKVPSDVQQFLNTHYDGGLILMDDYARTISIVRSPIPMHNVIYVGTKPYWEHALEKPQSQAQWVIMQKNDAVWNALYTNPARQGNLYKYFNKVYTSKEILIFKRNPHVPPSV